MFSKQNTLAKVDPELWQAIEAENRRQEDHIELIASENYVSAAVMEAQGSQLTNKYAEGYPGKRYYGGCEFVDLAEQLAIDRLKALFGAEAANVQPNSGSQANQAVLMAFAKPGDTIMGMSLAEGGHLTHGMPLNMSGKWFNVVAYGLNEQEEIDYDKMEALAREHKPRIIIAGASAYALRIAPWLWGLQRASSRANVVAGWIDGATAPVAASVSVATTASAGTRTAITRASSPPDTMSNPAPRRANRLSTARLLLAFTA